MQSKTNQQLPRSGRFKQVLLIILITLVNLEGKWIKCAVIIALGADFAILWGNFVNIIAANSPAPCPSAPRVGSLCRRNIPLPRRIQISTTWACKVMISRNGIDINILLCLLKMIHKGKGTAPKSLCWTLLLIRIYVIFKIRKVHVSRTISVNENVTCQILILHISIF